MKSQLQPYSRSRFGLGLRELRESVGHTPETLARAVGCQAHTVRDIESNARPFPSQLIIPWSNELKIPFEQMLVFMANDMMRRLCLEIGVPLVFKIVPADWELDGVFAKRPAQQEEIPWRG